MTSEQSHAVVLPSEDCYLGEYPEWESSFMSVVLCKYCYKSLLPFAYKDHIDGCLERIAKADAGCDQNISSSARSNGETSRNPSFSNYEGPVNEIDARCLKSHFSKVAKLTVSCKYCGFRVKPDLLNAHIEQSHKLSSTPISSGNSLPSINSFVFSEVDTSSSNSSPIWESDKNNCDISLSSSSSSSVNIVRLKSDKSKHVQKDSVIPTQHFPRGPKVDYTAQELLPTHRKLSPSSQISVSSSPTQKFVSSPTQKLSFPQSVDMLPMNIDREDALLTYSNPKTFERHSFFKTEPSSSFVTSVKESPSEIGKTPKLIIRRVPQQSPNDVRRNTIKKGLKESSSSENLQYFLVEKGNDQLKNKTSKHHARKRLLENHKIRETPDEEREEYIRASEQQITFLSSRIEVLNKQIETLNRQVGPLRVENEEYKAEIRNLRSRVEELENNSISLVELKKLNTFWERKSSLQEALSENLLQEKEILERNLPPGVHYKLVMEQLLEIQSSRSLIYTLLSGTRDRHVSNTAALSQSPRSARQIVNISEYVPMNSQRIESLPGTNGQGISVLNLGDNKVQYQSFSCPVTQVDEVTNLKERESCGGDGHVS